MDILSLKRDYESNIPISDLLVKYNLKSSGNLYYYLKKYNIPLRGKVMHYDNPFLVESDERDYWLGWIFSDGSVCQKGNTSFVYLACLDLDILLKFKDFCGNRAKLNKFKYTTPKSRVTKTMYKIVINSKELVSYFKDTFNVLGKKADNLNPKIKITWSLLRGILDGDGSFKRGIVLTSKSKSWIDMIANFYNQYGLHYTITEDSAYRLAIYRKEDLKKVYHYLYDNASIYLKRKQLDLKGLARE